MKNIRIFLLSSMVVLLTACGGGGSGASLPTVDNSLLTDTENQYGYFGEEVIFVNQKIVGGWFLDQESSDAGATMNFSSDGDGTYQERGSSRILYGDYGVSQDGRLITAQYVDPNNAFSFANIEIRYLSLYEDMIQTTYPDGTVEVNDCYRVELKISTLSGGGTYDDITMCP